MLGPQTQHKGTVYGDDYLLLQEEEEFFSSFLLLPIEPRAAYFLPLWRAAGRDGATRRDHRPKATARLEQL